MGKYCCKCYISYLNNNDCFQQEDEVNQENICCALPNIWKWFEPCLTNKEDLQCYAFVAYECSICTLFKGLTFTIVQVLCPLGCVLVPTCECCSACSDTLCSKDSCCYNN